MKFILSSSFLTLLAFGGASAAFAPSNLRGSGDAALDDGQQQRALQGGTTSSCNEPLAIGEIRNFLHKSKCLDVKGNDGKDNVVTFGCDGLPDQKWRLCEDGTIRNTQGFCLDVKGQEGRGNVEAFDCEVFPTISQDQQWERIRPRAAVDSGIEQETFQLRNKKSGECLDVGRDGTSVQTFRCDGSFGTDHTWYVRNRGAVIGQGKLVNKASAQCLDVAGSDGSGNIGTFRCEDRLDQTWTLYENGELVNARSGLCVDIAGTDGTGDIQTFPCEGNDRSDQNWTKELVDGEFFSLVSKRSNHCIDVAGGDGTGNVGTFRCDDRADQKWTFASSNFVTPIGSWDVSSKFATGEIRHQRLSQQLTPFYFLQILSAGTM